MKIYEIYFSPTGGTKKVTDIIGGVWDMPMEEIDLSLPNEDFSKYSFQKEDICIISVPSFGGRAPDVALTRLGNMAGGDARTIITVVYGNRAYEDTLLELKDAVTLAGFHCVGAIAAVAEHSIMNQFAESRPDEKDKAELMEFAKKIKSILELKNNQKLMEVPGNIPYKEYKGVPFKPKADKTCTQCGICGDKCPVGAIRKDNSSEVNEEKCISCMRCVSICPRHARKLNKVVLLAASQKLKKACSVRKENELYI